MPGQPRWAVLAPYASRWEPATARGRLWNTGRGYPAVRFDPDGDPVPGVLVALTPEVAHEAVDTLDRVERVGVLFERVEVATSAGPAIAYEWLGPIDGLEPLADGWPAARRPHHGGRPIQ
jgi:gamma-glutamylcyclotransferase (GGCT)/AIG2-like uncharacterized protein YtfP